MPGYGHFADFICRTEEGNPRFDIISHRLLCNIQDLLQICGDSCFQNRITECSFGDVPEYKSDFGALKSKEGFDFNPHEIRNGIKRRQKDQGKEG